jgi:serine/threonine-protein kinase
MGSLFEKQKPSSGYFNVNGPPLLPPMMFGRFVIEREIGRGAHSVVYRAADPAALENFLALKVLYPEPGKVSKQDLLTEVKIEAERLRTLQHPSIVPLLESGVVNDSPYLCFPFIKGYSLDRAMASGVYAPLEAAKCLPAIARAVHYAHQQGLIHRDLKPRNILISADGKPYVLDFGLCRKMGERVGADERRFVGTPAYMSPEQAKGEEKKLTPAADVYALGAILYDILTGRPPFAAETPWKTMQMAISTAPTPPRRFDANISPDMERFVLWCLEKEPGKRYPRADEFADDLERILAEQSPKGPGGFWRRLFK